MSAYLNLINNQRQLDQDGVEVGVSRQALDQMLISTSHLIQILDAIYDWTDMVEGAGGLTCISGVAKGHAMMESLKRNRPRIDEIVKDLRDG